MVGISFKYDWLRKWQELSEPIVERQFAIIHLHSGSTWRAERVKCLAQEPNVVTLLELEPRPW